ncbi:DUF421 domain-containing protein [Tepidibacter mesophilus]|uniref:DUF421 domain-containing protein n=1 Tax=Tepidibacter mesophilus TaxID=655607 RepID=UPI000C08C84B|nr:DUF421 domain-containing protein [Tepidibacter mesophilus]
MEFILKTVILITAGSILLRISGRKSISQMTITQTVIMISIGSLIVQPISGKSVKNTLVTAVVFIIFLIASEYLQIKFDFIETLITGKSISVIENGVFIKENLKKLRMTTDQLEMRLRQQGISKISDVKTATLEPNGQIGYELIRSAKPVTIGDFEQMMSSLVVKPNIQQQSKQEDDGNIFVEVKKGFHTKEINKTLK